MKSTTTTLTWANTVRLKRLKYQYKCVTAGEKLYLYLRSEFIDSEGWEEVGVALEPTGRSLELVDLFQQIAAVNLTGRLVVAGSSFADRDPVSDPLFRQAFEDFAKDTLGESGERFDRVYRLAEQAVVVARRPPTQAQLDRFERWAQRNHPHCYMCAAELDFTRARPQFTYTCEHVWPRMYGGDSIDDNFLPCCADCNSRVKRDLATWSQVNVQSLILGVGLKPEKLQKIDNVYNFAMHHRVAQRYAAVHNRTLKRAFIEVGPWTDVRVLIQHDACDFFNLGNHDRELVLD